MPHFLHALASGADWQTLCRGALARLGPVPAGSHLGFCYLTEPLAGDAPAILERLREGTGVPHWVGAVGGGVIGTGRECYDQPAMSLLVTHLPAAAFQVIPAQTDDCGAFLTATRAWRQATLASVAIVHGDPRNTRTPRLIAGLAQGLEGGFLVGGLGAAEEEQALVQIADEVTSGGLSGVLLSGSVPLVSGLSQGCALLGPRHRITAAQGNILGRLDGRPALEVLREDLGPELAEDLERLGGQLFAALPIPGSDTGDYLVRNLLGMDPDSGLLAVGERLQEGVALQFARRDPDTARQDLGRMLHDVRSRLTGRPLGALYFSCIGRGRNLFGDDSAELELVREALGDLPLAGFYANGEVSHNRLYGYTGVLAVFTEPQ